MAAPMASREEVRSAEELSGSHTMVMGSVEEAASPPVEAEAVSAPAAAPEPPAAAVPPRAAELENPYGRYYGTARSREDLKR